MRKIIKKGIGITLAVCMCILTAVANVEVANAADKDFTSSPKSQDDKFFVSYDSSKYQIFWVSREKITAKNQFGSTWWHLDKGDKLGTATIRVYYLEPKYRTGTEYYAIAGCQVSMDPVDVGGDVTGMSQLVDFGIKTVNPDSRVCSPTVDVLNIQASKTSSISTNFTAGTGLKYDTDKKKWEASGEVSFGKTWGSSSTYTYNMTNVNLIQKNKNGVYASWRYDYKSRDEDVTWNAYLMSSSKVAGQVVYRLNYFPTSLNRELNVPTKIYYDIRFGAGDSVTGEVENRPGFSGSRDMSVKTGTFTMSY